MTAGPNPIMLTPEDMARMSPSDVQAYISGLASDADKRLAVVNARMAKDLRNQAFLAMTLPYYTPCTAMGQSGNPFQATLAANQNIIFNVPPQIGGILESLIFVVDAVITYTPAGAGPTITLNAAAPYNIFDSIQVKYGSVNVDYGQPYFYTLLDGIGKGYNKTAIDSVFTGGIANASVQALLRNGLTTNSGANNWRFVFRLDRNPLNDQAVPGLLPITGQTQMTVTVRTAATLIGRDPLLHLANTNATALTLGGTLQVFAEYRDGTTTAMLQPLMGPDLAGEPTFSTLTEPDMALRNANAWNRQRIQTVGQHYYMFATVIDYNQSDRFSAWSNINGWQLTKDEAGQNPLWAFGIPGNVPKEVFFMWVRRHFGQDWPEGIIPWVIAPAYNESDPDDRMGRLILNMEAGAWQNLYQGYNLTTLNGIGGGNPRVVTFVGTIQKSGLAIVGV